MAVTPPPAPGVADPDPQDIQGNMVGFNKDHQRLVFVGFPDAASAKAFLAAIAPDVATASEVLAFNALYKEVRDRGGEEGTVEATWLNVALSAAGLTFIGARGADTMPAGFTAGMAAQVETLGDVDDSAPAGWLAPFNTGAPAVHAVMILAADAPEDLDAGYTRLQAKIAAANVTELGRIRTATRVPIRTVGTSTSVSRTGSPSPALPGHPTQPGDPTYPQPTPPIPGLPDWTHNGSFLVYRRLRQDVGSFNQFVAQTAQQLGMDPDQLAAKFVGRWRSGAPMENVPALPPGVDPSATDPYVATPAVLADDQINAFDYEPGDADGSHVPRAAHIRKVNPRSENPPGKVEPNRHRMLRRGSPYGPEFQPTEPPFGQGPVGDDRDRGLLFLCYQSSLARSFMFVQQTWANARDFPQPMGRSRWKWENRQ